MFLGLLAADTGSRAKRGRWVYEGRVERLLGPPQRLTAESRGVLQGILAARRGAWPFWRIPGWLLFAIPGRVAEKLAKSPGWLLTFKGGAENIVGVGNGHQVPLGSVV